MMTRTKQTEKKKKVIITPNSSKSEKKAAARITDEMKKPKFLTFKPYPDWLSWYNKDSVMPKYDLESGVCPTTFGAIIGIEHGSENKRSFKPLSEDLFKRSRMYMDEHGKDNPMFNELCQEIAIKCQICRDYDVTDTCVIKASNHLLGITWEDFFTQLRAFYKQPVGKERLKKIDGDGWHYGPDEANRLIHKKNPNYVEDSDDEEDYKYMINPKQWTRVSEEEYARAKDKYSFCFGYDPAAPIYTFNFDFLFFEGLRIIKKPNGVFKLKMSVGS